MSDDRVRAYAIIRRLLAVVRLKLQGLGMESETVVPVEELVTKFQEMWSQEDREEVFSSVFAIEEPDDVESLFEDFWDEFVVNEAAQSLHNGGKNEEAAGSLGAPCDEEPIAHEIGPSGPQEEQDKTPSVEADLLPGFETLLEQRRQELVLRLGIEDAEIERLAEEGADDEVCARFVAARQMLGLDDLQSAFEVYQRAIGLPRDNIATRDEKERLAGLLNNVAKALCAKLETDVGQGRLTVGGKSEGGGVFQLRYPSRVGLGQSLPLFRLRAADVGR